MLSISVRVLFVFYYLVSCTAGYSQGKSNLLPERSNVTIAYSLAIKSDSKNGIAESYNGGVKTVFISNGKVRSRLVSLMRTQSLFYFLPESKKQSQVVIVKESGKDKGKTLLSVAEWKQYNRKYDGIVTELLNDSTSLFNYSCKRAIVKLKDGRQIDVLYTPALHYDLYGLVEPAFAKIPGLVMRYEYRNADAVFTYTVVGLSTNRIAADVFQIQ